MDGWTGVKLNALAIVNRLRERMSLDRRMDMRTKVSNVRRYRWTDGQE